MQEAQNVIVENIDKLFDRDEKLNLLAIQSKTLNSQSRNINYMAAKIKKQEKMKQMKMMLMIGGSVVVFIIFILIMIL